MAVVARHLDAAVVWSDQVGLQVRVVIQFEAARVPGIGTGGSKVGMLFFKAGDGRVELGAPSLVRRSAWHWVHEAVAVALRRSAPWCSMWHDVHEGVNV